MKALIATPSTGGTVAAAYGATLIAASKAFSAVGWDYSHMNIDGADVVMARNYLANMFLRDESYSHILFLDSDMAVERRVIEMMIARNVDMAAAVYTERALDLDAFAAQLRDGADKETATALAARFNVQIETGKVRVEHGFVRLSAVGFGCVLITRAVFERLIAADAVKPLISGALRRAGLTGDAHDFFDEILMPDGDWLSEDYAFCKRVRDAKAAEIFGYVGDGVRHVGPFSYGAPYLARLRTGKA